jgi:DNA gyrase inhibitor GyrI
MKRMWLTVSILAATVALVLVGCLATRAGYESAPYRVVRGSGKFELRDYPALGVVETRMAHGRNGSDGSFKRLFQFISGGNEANQKIAMTTPVFVSGNETNGTMAFVMPAKMKSGDVPKPSDGNVIVRELAAGRFAVLRYSGGRGGSSEAKALQRLRAWIKSEGLKEVSSPIYGYFDPPWTPAFLRRNEVMIRVQPGT